ncbi:MAG: MoaD/ThiS family protein [Actinobacteria bacterium]|nr:MoaD/ThiS family protein [Actinomycetota bacterium]MCB9389093.1 MoaD/ThiS family protein [Acidimicrobiia bacterium]
MPVEVRLPTIFRQHANGQAKLTVDASTVSELFDELTAAYPGLGGQLLGEDGQMHKFVNVYRNDEDIRYLDKLDTPLSSGDVVSILPAVAGGQ